MIRRIGGKMETRKFIRKAVSENKILLFMKGTAQFPQCGFSGKVVDILKKSGVSDLATVNVLEDDSIRQGIKDYSEWPTVPQLYIDGKFIGGADIISEMYDSGELRELLIENKLVPAI
tara:strand:- start:3494 stop:3847 length:354 start_codon:yes stop_codon:yes gene_type:complete